MKRLFLALAFVPLIGLAHGQTYCDTREVILKTAFDHYGEVPNSGGSNRSGTLFTELLLAPDGSFTLIMSRPDGWACVISSGIEWGKLGGIPGEDG